MLQNLACLLHDRWYFYSLSLIFFHSMRAFCSVFFLGKSHKQKLFSSNHGFFFTWKCNLFETNLLNFSNRTDRRSKMISAPTNFNHITHLGPGDGIQNQRLIDLPTTIETADSHSPQPSIPHPRVRKFKKKLNFITKIINYRYFIQHRRLEKRPRCRQGLHLEIHRTWNRVVSRVMAHHLTLSKLTMVSFI